MNRRSFHSRLMRTIITSVVAAVAVIAAVAQIGLTRNSEQQVVNEALIVGEILSQQAAPVIISSDPKAAQAFLSSASFLPSLDRLCLYSQVGELISHYKRAAFQGGGCRQNVSKSSLQLDASVDNGTFHTGFLVTSNQQQVGYLHLQGNLDGVVQMHWVLYVALAGILSMTVLWLCLVLVPALRKSVNPINELSDAVSTYVEGRGIQQGIQFDGSDLENNSEIGGLVTVINRMLDKLSGEKKSLLASEQRFRSLADHSPVGIYFKDKDHNLIYANQKWLDICGIKNVDEHHKFYTHIHPRDQRAYANTFNDVANSSEVGVLEYRCNAPDLQKTSELLEHVAPLKTIDNGTANQSSEGFIGSVVDISELKSVQKELEKLAFNDPLTKLPNRRFFNDHLSSCMNQPNGVSKPLVILMIDLDNFKRVNDSLGHDSGDKLLTVIGQRLRHEVSSESLVARMGGDEFVVLVESNCLPEKINELTKKILNVVTRPIAILRQGVDMTCSIGIAQFPEDATSPNDLLRNADIALSQAKLQGRNCFAYFSRELHKTIQERIRFEAKLRNAVITEKLSLVIQPQFDANKNGFYWGEVLLRWYDQEEGFIPPDKFIPIAEETGLIVRIGQWVFHEVCRILSDHEDTLNDIGIAGLSVNLSARQFFSKNLFKQMRRSMDDYTIHPSRLEVEITESMVMEDVDSAIDTMNKMRDLGLRISIDDFGTGYSSLAYLKNFAIDSVKIDRSFVKELPSNQNDVAITTAILAMAERLDVKVIAEGVETREQQSFLHRNGCHLMQGYLFARPVPVEDLLGVYPEQIGNQHYNPPMFSNG